MTIKQTIHKQPLTMMLIGGLIASCSLLIVPTASADPAVTQVTCNDGTEVTVHNDDAKPNDTMNDADYKAACKKHEGYTKIGETIVCKDDSQQNVYKDMKDPKDKLDDKDRAEACRGHGGIKPDEISAEGCGGVDTAIIKCDADNSGGIETNGVWALLLMAINILTAGVGIAAVGGIIYGSIMYTTAGDNEGQVKQAKEIIRNVIIGIIAYVAMYALLQFIVPGGIFS